VCCLMDLFHGGAISVYRFGGTEVLDVSVPG
jgi:hypothetical protein